MGDAQRRNVEIHSQTNSLAERKLHIERAVRDSVSTGRVTQAEVRSVLYALSLAGYRVTPHDP
jgi:hypothetical protein